MFGSYQIREVGGKLRQEGLIHGNVTPAEMKILEQYVADHPASNGGHLRLHSRRTFLREVFWPVAYKLRARVCGFNLPFDLSRLAYDWGRAKDGGFRLELFESVDADGRVWPDRFRPAIRIKTISSRQQFISFVAPATLDASARVDGHVYRGRFLDLHMLAYALTDKSLSLDRAAREFGLEVSKELSRNTGSLRRSTSITTGATSTSRGRSTRRSSPSGTATRSPSRPSRATRRRRSARRTSPRLASARRPTTATSSQSVSARR